MGQLSRWVIFITIFLCIYGTLHLYALVKVRRALYLEGLGYILLLVVLAVLMIAPIHATILSGQGYHTLALATYWIAYLWMGFLLLFVCVSLPIDAYQLVLGLAQRLFKTDLTNLMMLRRQSLTLGAVIAGVAMIYGFVAAYNVRTETVTIETAKLPAGTKRVRIVQLSDLHIGPMFYMARLNRILSRIRYAQPDILVCTGDLIEGDLRTSTVIAQMLQVLPAPMGKFAVTGNHEFHFGIEKAEAFTKSAGFTLLRDKSVLVDDLINIAGVDDSSAANDNTAPAGNWAAGLAKNRYTVLLKHRPTLDETGALPFDLQLSGHTHNGQIFPYSLLIQWMYPMHNGLYSLAKGRYLYASPGTGTWGPPIRILAPPEITIIDIVPSPAKKATPAPAAPSKDKKK